NRQELTSSEGIESHPNEAQLRNKLISKQTLCTCYRGNRQLVPGGSFLLFWVRGRDRNLCEPSIQLGDQVFEAAHRMQFGEDRAMLIESPGFDAREFSLLQPRAEL